MSADKYPSIFSRQMKAIVYLFRLFGSAGNLLVLFVSLGKLEFSLFTSLGNSLQCFIRLAGHIVIQSVYLGVVKEHCLPLDSSRKRSLPSGILRHILTVLVKKASLRIKR